MYTVPHIGVFFKLMGCWFKHELIKCTLTYFIFFIFFSIEFKFDDLRFIIDLMSLLTFWSLLHCKVIPFNLLLSYYFNETNYNHKLSKFSFGSPTWHPRMYGLELQDSTTLYSLADVSTTEPGKNMKNKTLSLFGVFLVIKLYITNKSSFERLTM